MKRMTALCLLLCLLCGCAPRGGETPSADTPIVQEQSQNQICRVAFFEERTINPLTTRVGANVALYRLVFDGLFELTPDFQAVPMLCDGYTRDGNVWKFTLRSMTFSDGTALTAQDVVYSYNLAKQEESAYASRFQNIERFRAVNSSVVEVVTKSPNDDLPALLDIPVIKRDENATVAVGTGPYQIIYEGVSPVLVKNHYYGEAAMPYERIEIVSVGSEEQLAKELRAGKISMAAVDITATDAVSWGGDCDHVDYPTTTMLYLGFQTRSKALRSATVRRAIACALDRESIAGKDFSGFADASGIPVHPAAARYSAQVADLLAYSPATARDHLAAAGRETLTVSLLVNAENPSKVSAAQRIAESLSAASITVNVETVPWEQFVSRLQSGRFELYLGEVVLSADFDIAPLVAPGGALNYGGFSSEYLSSAIYTARSGGDDSAYLRQFADEVPFAPILFKRDTLLVQKNYFAELTPAVHNPFYHFFDWKRVS